MGASNALSLKSQPLCPELSIWGASLPNIAPLQTAGCWGLDPPRWSTDSPVITPGAMKRRRSCSQRVVRESLNKDPKALLQNHIRNATWPLFLSHV